MRLNKFIFLLFSMLIGSTIVYGQNFFREGYIIKSNGDTLNGLIQFEENQDLSQKCIFKRFDLAVTITYTPESIRSFGYKNANYFETKVINGKTLFMECLLKGELSLFVLSKKIYIEELDNRLIELKAEPIVVTRNTKRYEFASVLEYLKDITSSVSTMSIPSKIKIIDSDLIPIIREYNQKANVSYIVYNRRVKKELFEEATMLTGVNMKSFGLISTFNTNKSDLNTGSDKSYTKVADLGLDHKDWTIGIFYNSRLSRMNKKFFWQIELLFSKRSYYSYAEFTRELSQEIHRVDLNSDLNVYKVPIMVQYRLPYKKSTFYVNLGLSYNYNIYRNRNAMLEIQAASNHIYTYDALDYSKSNVVNIFSQFAGLGVKYKVHGNKSIFFETRVETGKAPAQEIKFDYYFSPKIVQSQNSSQFTFIVGISI